MVVDSQNGLFDPQKTLQFTTRNSPFRFQKYIRGGSCECPLNSGSVADIEKPHFFGELKAFPDLCSVHPTSSNHAKLLSFTQ